MRSVEEFWSLVDQSGGPDACWPWMRVTRSDGRGRVDWHGRDTYVYRLAWELANGRPIPNGLLACHKCDNPTCANPTHIFLGTMRDNLQDAAAKNRTYKPAPRYGLANIKATVSDEIVEEALALYATGEFTYVELAERYGVDRSTIGCWVRGRTRRAAA